MKVLITGASEGIGRAFATRFARDGYEVTAVARNESRLQELISEIGEKHRHIVADLTKSEDLNRVCDYIKTQGYDLLINNAGFGVTGKFRDTEIEKHVSVLRLNCEALMVLSHCFLQTAKSGDALINVSSVLAFIPTPYNSVYAATKAFVTSLTNSLWYEARSKGVYVMGLCPGLTRTEFQKRSGREKIMYPPLVTQDPDDVVNYALKGLAKRKSPVIISGPKNSFISELSRFIPRKFLVNIAGRART